jgi:predicted Fe-S protein YdhL (DUF1289 family)
LRDKARKLRVAPVAPDSAPWLNPAMREPISPCNRVCRIDQRTGWCLGCRRTLTEIADWPMLTPAEKQALIDVLDRRI